MLDEVEDGGPLLVGQEVRAARGSLAT